MYVYYTLIYTSYTLGPWSILYEDDVNLSPEFEGNIVKYHANTFLCRDCSVFIIIIIIYIYKRYLLYTYTTPPRHCGGSSLRIPKVHVPCSSRCMNNVVTQNVLGEKKIPSVTCVIVTIMCVRITSERLASCTGIVLGYKYYLYRCVPTSIMIVYLSRPQQNTNPLQHGYLCISRDFLRTIK